MNKKITKLISNTFNIDFIQDITKIIISYDLELSLTVYFNDHIQSNMDYILKINYKRLYTELIYDFETKCKIKFTKKEKEKISIFIKEKIVKNMFG